MNYISIAEDADNLADRIAFADVGEELISQTCAFRCALDDACDIDEGDCGRNDFFRTKNLGEHLKAGIRDAYNANIWFDCGEGVIGSQDIVLGQGVEEGRLSDIR